MEQPGKTEDQRPAGREATLAPASPEREVLRAYFARLLQQNGVDIPPPLRAGFEAFAAAPERASAYQTILTLQQQVMRDWKEITAIQDILQKTVQIPNGKVGRPYRYGFDPEALGLKGLAAHTLTGFGETGLGYDAETQEISGTPVQSGEFRLRFQFRLAISDPEKAPEEKPLTLIINADPKSLWKELPSDDSDPYWKPDAESNNLAVAGKKAVAASKRGRSHAHEGKFRDDDFLLAHLPGDWSLLAVADGAGSAGYSRRGAQLACLSLQEFFAAKTPDQTWSALDAAISAAAEAASGDAQKALSQQVISRLQQAAKSAHDAIAAEAKSAEAGLRDFGTTLLFALVKPVPSGWFIASFGVGDGAIGLYRQDKEEVQLLTRPDGGEFAGQTRFLTMPEIFGAADFYQRFAIRLVPDFTALLLMTDGITDPKFATDAALAQAGKWTALWDDLQGGNEDGASVAFGDEDAPAQLLSWLDFWSPGNHDDRTIVVLS
jgi:serine/threonine protein phosphatase PrpC